MIEKTTPIILALLQNKKIEEIDYFFAKTLSEKEDENLFLALIILFSSSRQGNLCFSFESPFLKFFLEGTREINPDLKKKIIRGFEALPKKIVEEIETERQIPTKPIVKYKNSFYLHKNYIFEKRILDNFWKISQEHPIKLFEEKALQAELFSCSFLSPLQKKAIEKVLLKSLSFIFGGPGTGKTYVAIQIIEILSKIIKTKIKVVIAAPTGKAAMNLVEKFTNFEHPLIQITASTLHSLLKKGSFFSRIEADLLIIDEASMIDASLLDLLFRAINQGTRTVLIGDPHQLPPIGMGNLFSLFSQLNLEESSCVLQKCLRCESKEMLLLSEAVKQAEPKRALDILSSTKKALAQEASAQEALDQEPLLFIPEHKDILGVILQKAEKYFLTHAFEEEKKISAELKKYFSFRVLAACRYGPLGTDCLNQTIYETLKAKSSSFFSYPIMVTKNDYNLELFNGMTGVVIEKPFGPSMAYFEVKNKIKKIPLFLLPSFSLAYALSIHKSQGSEFDHVFLILSQGDEVFGRELFYTAITRAKKSLQVFSSKETIFKIIQNKTLLQSNFLERAKTIWSTKTEIIK